MKEIVEEEMEEENKNNSHEITSSTLELKQSQDYNTSKDKEKEEKEINNDNHNINNDDNKITADVLKDIIGEENLQEENEKEEEEEEIPQKTQRTLSHDEMIENELSIIKKKNLSKYLMEDNQFKSSGESEEEIDPNNTKYKINNFFCLIVIF